MTGTPTISLFHTDIVAYIKYYLGNHVYNLISPIIPILIKNFSEAYDINFFSSQEQLDRYKKLKSQRSDYLPYQGVDCQKFQPANISYDPIPNDNRLTLLFVGRITPEKNLTQLIDIYKLIVRKISDVHLVIIGSGPQEAEIRKLAQEFEGITVWGESHGTELLGWYARAHVFINPSVTENFCTANNEALASGTPVVAAIAPSTAEQIFPGRNGFLAEANNITDFADKALAILQNPELMAQMSEQARLSILPFDWSACMQKFEDKLYEIVELSKRP